VFFERWNDNEKQKKTFEKKELAKHRWYSQMGQVGTGASTWDRWNRDRGYPYWVGQDGTGTAGSPYWVGQDGTETGGSSD